MTVTSHIVAALFAVLLTAAAFQQAIVVPAAPFVATHELA